jgi:hypothetical protein
MDVQVRDSIAEYRRIHVLGSGYAAHCPARLRAPPADGTGLSVSKIG